MALALATTRSHFSPMPDVTSFDWFRWIDVPVLLAMGGILCRHMWADHRLEVDLTAKLSRLETLHDAIDGVDRRQDIILKKLMGVSDERDE